MWDFLDSNFFVALVTGISAIVAVILYERQKRETKQKAAIILINEIRNAESSIQIVSDTIRDNPKNATLPEITILSENNWNKYSNLFSKDFDQDEIRLINKFYADAERINYIVTQANNMFIMQVIHRTSAIQHANLNLVAQAKDSDDIKKAIIEFEKRLWNKDISSSPYIPQGFNDKLKKYLPDVQPIISTPIGEKFKKISLDKKFILF